MGWEDIAPMDPPAWRQKFNACENCERLEAENAALSDLFDAAGVDNNILHERERVLREALEGLISSLELVHKDPEYQAVWQLYQNHIPTGYRGRKYTEQLDIARAALAQKGG